jgi:hypothetical protein
MEDVICYSVFNNNIRINNERWQHITTSHDYMIDKFEIVIDTLSNPDLIVKANSEEYYAIRKYENLTIGSKSCVVIYIDKPNGFVITSLLTSKPHKFIEKGEIIWKQ